MAVSPPTRVLIVDDSAIVRKLLGDALRGEPDIEVIGGAADPFIARDMIVQHKPDLVTLDIEMPRMDGLTFLRKLMQHYPLPVIIVSSVTKSGSAASIEALRAGAMDVIPKPGGPTSVGQVTDRLKERIRSLRAAGGGLRVGPKAPAAVQAPAPARSESAVRGRRAQGLLLIGASTGGPQAIEALLSRLPADVPPTLIVQHMPANFTAAFAGRLNTVCPMRVVEATGGEVLERGTVYIAPGDQHLLVERVGVQLRTVVKTGPQVHHQRPAVDVLFYSAAKLSGVPMVGVLLTGMGADGADGMVALRNAGAETIAEDEHSCVVFGMPKEAIQRGGAGHVATLLSLPALIYDCFDALAKRAA
ncbi:MAG: chemotaxis response regulator protein-glutamate methylesterase [Vicinamibacterales bacterium]